MKPLRDSLQLRLSGSRCQCTVCDDYFGSERGFMRHRVGEMGTPQRRCLTPEELVHLQWVRDVRGFWLQPDARRSGDDLGALSSVEPAEECTLPLGRVA